MDRDVALSVLTAVTAIKTAVQTIATNITPTEQNRNTETDTKTVPESETNTDKK